MNKFFLKIVVTIFLCAGQAHAMDQLGNNDWQINMAQENIDRAQSAIDQAQKQKEEIEYVQQLPEAIKTGLLAADLRMILPYSLTISLI